MKFKSKKIILCLMSVLLLGCNGGNNNSNSSSEESLTSNSQNASEQSPESSLGQSSIIDNVSSSPINPSSNVTSESVVSAIVDNAIKTYKVYSEGMTATFTDIDVSKVKVEYKLKEDEKYQVLDKELIRKINDTEVRFDIVGLKSGIYDINITTSDSKVLKMSSIEISSYDRSGYAHFKADQAVGGYNNDGSVKDNAVIVYVNDENKNTVTATIGGKECVGIAEILHNQSNSSVPLIIRIVGRVNAATWKQIKYTKSGSTNLTEDKIVDQNGVQLPKQNMTEEEIVSGNHNQLDTSKYTKLNGLSNRIKYSKGEYDSYYNMMDVVNAKNVTVEGIGDDAMIFQWGFTWKNCSYIEIRNLTFDDYTEDACSFEGPDDSATLEGFTTGHIWIHNNNFNEGINYWDVCPEQDKLDGDGATDFKKNAYITISYNHYYKNHKTGLVGGGDAQKTACLTFHHNFYDQCSMRLPLARQANMHMYNNYYFKTSTTSLSIRAGAYAFVEGCYFEGGNNPIEVKTGDGKKGVVKSYKNVFSSTKGSKAGIEVNARDAKVANDNIYDKEFDTNPTNFYYDVTNKVSDVTYLSSANQAKIDVKANAGPQKNNVLKVEGSTPSEQPSTSSSITSAAPIQDSIVFNARSVSEGQYNSPVTSGAFVVNASETKTVTAKASSGFTKFDSSYTHEIDLEGAGTSSYRSISFALTKAMNITIYARSNNTAEGRNIVIASSLDGSEVFRFDPVTTSSEMSYELSPGSYYICSASKGMSIGAIVLTSL